MQIVRIYNLRSILEAVNWVCDDALDDRVWVSEITIALQEANILEPLQYDLEIHCVVQWRLLRFSAPTSLNDDLLLNMRRSIGLSEVLLGCLTAR